MKIALSKMSALILLGLLLLYKKGEKWYFIQLIGAILLFVLSLLMMKEKFYHVVQLFEHTFQFGTLALLDNRDLNAPRLASKSK
ncbi:hypothetical protein [Aquimarina sp. RZ0]|uniref:hypothetical protein n=1 Tax=Aquimarina sp. RZ0 TaxID=2607730 RepID=UPI0011F3A675|nr:hypothetical protein [Aquimarina sp. RZ0]KAA1243649.1 hypothetical protein F0000_20015 [Aquimarina sp. RZ0]